MVVHEESADEIVLVAEPRRADGAGQEEKARILDPAGREHEERRAHHVFPPGPGDDPDVRDRGPAAGLFERADRRVHEDVHVGRALERIAPLARERGAAAKMLEARGDARRIEGQGSARGRGPVVQAVGARLDPADAERARIERIELCPRQRPAADGSQSRASEVDRIEAARRQPRRPP